MPDTTAGGPRSLRSASHSWRAFERPSGPRAGTDGRCREMTGPSWPGATHAVSVNWNVSLKEVLKEMATGRKGNGTTVRRRTKTTAKQAAATAQESNGRAAHNDAAEAVPNTEKNIETIRLRAYELFLARGATHGDDLADWLNAERELRGAPKP